MEVIVGVILFFGTRVIISVFAFLAGGIEYAQEAILQHEDCIDPSMVLIEKLSCILREMINKAKIANLKPCQGPRSDICF